MKNAHHKNNPTWEMSTQWVLKSISGVAGKSGREAAEFVSSDWLGEPNFAQLSEEVDQELARLECKYAEYVTTNSRRRGLGQGRGHQE
jgi:hypothetical protein